MENLLSHPSSSLGCRPPSPAERQMLISDIMAERYIKAVYTKDKKKLFLLNWKKEVLGT